MARSAAAGSHNILSPWFQIKLRVKCRYTEKIACRGIEFIREPVDCILFDISKYFLHVLEYGYNAAVFLMILIQDALTLFFYHLDDLFDEIIAVRIREIFYTFNEP